MVDQVYNKQDADGTDGQVQETYENTSRFLVIERYRKGGQGVVYLADDERLGRIVALKEIRDELKDDLEIRKRFEFEARLTGYLEHPGVVPIYALGHGPGGEPYYVTRMVRGVTLRQAIRELHAGEVWSWGGRGRRADLHRLLRRLQAVCQTMSYVHGVGVVHRDLKPDNILLGDFGETLVIDWGLAKPFSAEGPTAPGADVRIVSLVRDRGEATSIGSAQGTLPYASPEQLRGDPDAGYPPCDVYSLGATLHQLLTGRAPLATGEDANQTLERVFQGRVPSPRQVHHGIPRALDAICRKAMATRREERYGTVAELEDDLDRWLEGEPVRACPSPPWEQLARWAKRHRIKSTVVATMMSLLLLLGIFQVQRSRLERSLVEAEIDRLQETPLAQVAAFTGSLAKTPDLASGLVAHRLIQVGDQARRRKLALALARLDPSRTELARSELRADARYRWNLARSLVGSNSDGVDAPDNLRWLLRPLRAELLEPLFFCEDKEVVETFPEELHGAGALLLDYASDRPDVLAWAITFASNRDFPAYLKLLKKTPEASRKHLSAVFLKHGSLELDPYRNPRWTEPSAADLQAIDDAQGLVLPHSLWCQTMPLATFLRVSETLRPTGFRPARVRPVVGARGEPLIAAIWNRDGFDWRLERDLSTDQARSRDREMASQGFGCGDVAVCPGPDPSHSSYSVLWVRCDSEIRLAARLHARSFQDWVSSPSVGESGRLEVGLSLEQARHDDEIMKPPLRRFALLQSLKRPDGRVEVGAIRQERDDWYDRFPLTCGPLATIREREGHLLAQTDVCRLPADHSGEPDRYLATWQEPSTYRTTFLDASDPASHREEARTLAAAGAWPLSVQSTTDKEGAISTVSVWASLHLARFHDYPAKPRVRAAIALHQLGDPGPLRSLLRSGPDPTERSWLIEMLRTLEGDCETLIREFRGSTDDSVRGALLQAIGNGDQPTGQDAFVEEVLTLACGAADPGLRASARWLARRWGLGEELAARDAKRPRGESTPGDGRLWFVNREGQEFTIVRGPVTFLMGETNQELEAPGFALSHRVQINRDFAIATTELTVAVFQCYLDDPSASGRSNRTAAATPFGREPDSPALGLSFYDVAYFCNWLSARCGIPRDQWCFIETPSGEIQLAPDYLRRTGYRMPTEAEWEYACRGGSVTHRPYGRGSLDSDALLERYAWCMIGRSYNSTQPVGLLKPNDMGLFDLLGNAHEWCLDPVKPYCTGSCEATVVDSEKTEPLTSKGKRSLRGGWFNMPVSGLGSAHRSWNRASYGDQETGVRLARTVRPL
ncbi:bifunctional serine/threonine-protein kinase/formylglycine-generating enzyme family protein [Aquisphaera insulae]|uniref:bifunctional serine/threonine-protein kinase/formylglycine-generating enzyme family protein n=1 Tax=Aquisphaera insulae TaxID=2712864 RepID=UPI0013EBED00|nr:bifunctional serine/threonine-protein kinase/formylglycine-generating enzyme family protein [Aquisphaera insulae]